MVAITKSDLGDVARVREQVRARLEDSSLGAAPLVATSVRTGEGLEVLKEALARECAAAAAPREIAKPRLFVDRAFTMHGSGTVVTGTLSGGELARGATVVLLPQNISTRVRALQSHNEALEVARPSTRVALNLPDVRLEEVPRGTLITSAANLTPCTTLDVLLRRSTRSAPRPLKTGASVQVHYGSARQTARVRLLDVRELGPGKDAIARLTFAAPVVAFAGDRFVLRDSSARATIAGGVVLDTDATGRRFRAAEQREFLSARAAAPDDLPVLCSSQLRRDGYARREVLHAKLYFSSAEIEEALRNGRLIERDGLVADSTFWRALSERAAKAIDAAHAARPNEPGLELTQLRATLALGDDTVLDALVADLCEHGFTRAGGALKRSAHRLSLSPELEQKGAAIRAALAAKPHDPPSRNELARDSQAQAALRFLVQTGEAIRLDDEVFVSAAAFTKMKELVSAALRRGPATASELRQLLGTTRRVLIPFLEHLDKTGVTVRDGDRRRLR